MGGHPAVVFLREALDQAEEPTRAATPGPWLVERDEYHGVAVRDADPEIPGLSGRQIVAFAPYRNETTERDFAHVAMWSPVAVLARVAADRQILAEHASDGDSRWPECVRCAGGHEIEMGECMTVTVRDVVPWPCRTVLLLAEAWGWTEDAAPPPEVARGPAVGR